jgi:hypothetical protein
MGGAPYDFHDVPALPDRSRWLLATSPSGFSMAPQETFSLALKNLLSERKASLAAFVPGLVSVQLKMVVRRGDSHELAERGDTPIEGLPTAVSARPGRRWRQGEKAPGEALDGLFLGLEPWWSSMPDGEAWDCAVMVAETAHLDTRALRVLNDSLALLLLARAGLAQFRDYDLPHPAGMVS